MCGQPFPICEVLTHQANCSRKKCNNELCGIELKDKVIKFNINGNDMQACSKKCKKVAKFAYMLKKNNETDILKTFESMLRKKMQKNLEQQSIQSRSGVSKSMMGIYSKSSYNTVQPKKIITGRESSYGAIEDESKKLHDCIEE